MKVVMNKLLNRWWWRTQIVVPWPTETVTYVAGNDSGSYTYSVSPDRDVWKWMNATVGKQGLDWEWDLCVCVVPTMGRIVLKFRPGKGHHAVMTGIKFS